MKKENFGNVGVIHLLIYVLIFPYPIWGTVLDRPGENVGEKTETIAELEQLGSETNKQENEATPLPSPPPRDPTSTSSDSPAAPPATEIFDTPPPAVLPRSSAEFYPTNPDSKVLVPVNVWGEVREPGVHFVPFGSSLAHAVGAAGGPTGLASMPKISLIRNAEEKRIDLYELGRLETVKRDDLIVVDRTFKTDLPLIFSAISTAVAVVTLYFVIHRK